MAEVKSTQVQVDEIPRKVIEIFKEVIEAKLLKELIVANASNAIDIASFISNWKNFGVKKVEYFSDEERRKMEKLLRGGWDLTDAEIDVVATSVWETTARIRLIFRNAISVLIIVHVNEADIFNKEQYMKFTQLKDALLKLREELRGRTEETEEEEDTEEDP